MSGFSYRYDIIYEKYLSHPDSAVYGKSKIGMARFLGATQGRTQHWEKGRLPNAEDCLSISDKLGFEVRWVISGEGNMLLSDRTEVPAKTAGAADGSSAEREATLKRENTLLRELVDSKQGELDKVGKIIALYESRMEGLSPIAHNGIVAPTAPVSTSAE